MIPTNLAPHLFDYAVNTLWQLPLLAAATWLLIRLTRTTTHAQHLLWIATLLLATLIPLHGNATYIQATDSSVPHSSTVPSLMSGSTESPPATLRPLTTLTPPPNTHHSNPPNHSHPPLAPRLRHQYSPPDLRLDRLTPPNRLRKRRSRSPRLRFPPVLRGPPANSNPRDPLPQLPLRHPRRGRHLPPHPSTAPASRP